jgi:hypothetical protein
VLAIMTVNAMQVTSNADLILLVRFTDTSKSLRHYVGTHYAKGSDKVSSFSLIRRFLWVVSESGHGWDSSAWALSKFASAAGTAGSAIPMEEVHSASVEKRELPKHFPRLRRSVALQAVETLDAR